MYISKYFILLLLGSHIKSPNLSITVDNNKGFFSYNDSLHSEVIDSLSTHNYFLVSIGEKEYKIERVIDLAYEIFEVRSNDKIALYLDIPYGTISLIKSNKIIGHEMEVSINNFPLLEKNCNYDSLYWQSADKVRETEIHELSLYRQEDNIELLYLEKKESMDNNYSYYYEFNDYIYNEHVHSDYIHLFLTTILWLYLN